MWDTIGSIREVSSTRRRLLWVSTGVLVIIQTLLVVASFETVRSLIALGTADTRSSPGDVTIADITWAVHVVGTRLPWSTCFGEALTGYLLLRRWGYDPRLEIGVRRDADEFQAHSWLEQGGSVILGDRTDLAEFTSFDSLGEQL